MRLVLIRHGQTVSNCTGALDTAMPGSPLTSVGHEQAAALIPRWDDIVGQVPSAVAVSPLTRTIQTAQPFLSHVTVDPLVRIGIREIEAGDIEMNTDHGSLAAYDRVVFDWMCGDLSVRMPGAESGCEVFARAHRVVREVCSRAYEDRGDEGVAAIVAHGALIRMLTCNLSDDLPAPVAMTNFMRNAHMTVLESVSPRWTKFRLALWNERPAEEWVMSV